MCAIAAAVLRRGWEISNWWNLQWNNIVVGISLNLQTIFPSFSKLYFSEPRSAIAAVSQRRGWEISNWWKWWRNNIGNNIFVHIYKILPIINESSLMLDVTMLGCTRSLLCGRLCKVSFVELLLDQTAIELRAALWSGPADMGRNWALWAPSLDVTLFTKNTHLITGQFSIGPR